MADPALTRQKGPCVSAIASRRQLHMSLLRWGVVTVPLLLLLGFLSGLSVPAGDRNAWYVALVKPAGTPPGWPPKCTPTGVSRNVCSRPIRAATRRAASSAAVIVGLTVTPSMRLAWS